MERKLSFSSIFWSILYLTLINHVKAKSNSGKTATKAGLAGIATVGGGSTGGGYGVGQYESSFGNGRGLNKSQIHFPNEIARLKFELLVKRNYDKEVRPVKHHSSVVHSWIDFTTTQIIDLNEKKQELSSYIYYRLFWMDELLTWKPEEYGNITSMWLPAHMVWKPDVMLYEDTGNIDYTSLRMPYVEVFSNGQVKYLEPTVIKSSCSVDITDFPFDHQHCRFTFGPWTMPSSKVDISARRAQSEMYKDFNRFFVSTGEWSVILFTVIKRSQYWGNVVSSKAKMPSLVNTSTLVFNNITNTTEEVVTYYPDTSHIRFYVLPATAAVENIVPDRVSDLHWSEIIFTLHLRRNYSLYLQSMLFPAILLTTIALLGFYLPPDSGERIGLQITILLTYMVFLLTVGEMFPASSGPYLGLYYVECMGLLGVNIGMTVTVLYMHYMPAAAVIKEERGPNGEIQTISPPGWIRWVIYITGACEIRSKCRSKKVHLTPNTRSNSKRTSKKSKGDTKLYGLAGNPIKDFKKKGKSKSESNLKSLENNKNFLQAGINKEFKERDTRNQTDFSQVRERLNDLVDKTKSLLDDEDWKDNVKQKSEKDPLIGISSGDAIEKMSDNISLLLKCVKEENEHLREKNVSEEIEDEWKAMARVVDGVCLKLYIALLVICHLIILLAALTDSSEKEPMYENV